MAEPKTMSSRPEFVAADGWTRIRAWWDRLSELATAVFPVASRQPIVGRTVVGYILGFVAALAYPLLLPATWWHLTHIWAEDGHVFLRQVKTVPVQQTVFLTYSDYVHVVPRLCALVIDQLPMGAAAVSLAVAAMAVRAGVAVIVFAAARAYSPRLWPRLAIAAAVVMLPVGNNETLANLTNLHWFTTFGAFWLLLWRPARLWQTALATIALFLAAASSPIGFILAPIGLARVVFLPSRRDWFPGVAFLLGVAIQFTPLVNNSRDKYAFDLVQATYAAQVRGPVNAFLGPEGAAALYDRLVAPAGGVPLWPGMVATAVIAVLAFIGIARVDAARRFLVLATLYVGALTTAVLMYRNWNDDLRIEHMPGGIATERYNVQPALFLFAVVVLGLAVVPRPHLRPFMWAARAAVAAVVVTGIVVQWNHPRPDYDLESITWSQSLDEARQECASGSQEVWLPLSPRDWFDLRLPCSVIPRAGA